MVKSVYRFHVYYYVRRVLKRLQVPLPHEASFNAANNPYTKKEFFKICEDYGIPHDPMRYRGEKFVDLSVRSWMAGRLHWSRLNDLLNNREIPGFYRCGVA